MGKRAVHEETPSITRFDGKYFLKERGYVNGP
jgi:hypothetical protein